MRLVNLYRPFKLKGLEEFNFFINQIQHLDKLITERTIIMDDFNLDLNKLELDNYTRKIYFEAMTNVLGHQNLDQLIMEDTWCRRLNLSLDSFKVKCKELFLK